MGAAADPTIPCPAARAREASISRPDPNLRSGELAASWEELRAAGREARELAGGLDRRALWWRPGPERWSVAECLDHLVRAGEVYLAALDEVIEDGRRRGLTAGASYRPTLVGRWLPRLLEPPPRLRVPAPGRIRPGRPEDGAGADAGDPLDAFLSLRGRFAGRLEAADGLDLGGIRLASPFFAWLRFDLGSAFRIVAAHERRHLWQAGRVLEADGFPGA